MYSLPRIHFKEYINVVIIAKRQSPCLGARGPAAPPVPPRERAARRAGPRVRSHCRLKETEAPHIKLANLVGKTIWVSSGTKRERDRALAGPRASARRTPPRRRAAATPPPTRLDQRDTPVLHCRGRSCLRDLHRDPAVIAVMAANDRAALGLGSHWQP